MINIIKPEKINISKIVSNNNSLSPSNYRDINIKNNKKLKIRSFLKDLPFLRGYETGSSAYVENSKLAFIRNSNINRISSIVNNDSCIFLKPMVKDENRIIAHEDILVVTDANISDSAIFIKLTDNNIDYTFSSGVVKLNIKDNIDKYYLLTLLRDNYFKEQLLAVTPKGATLKHSGDKFLECFLPHNDNEWVIKKLSNVMKNICHMEYLCRNKLLEIFSIYDNELNSFDSTEHKNLISKILKNKRIDAGFYSSSVNDFFYKVEAIGSNTLKDLGFIIKRGPNLAKRDLGRSIQTNIPNKKYYRLIYPSDISDSGRIVKETYLGTSNKIWQLSQGDILFSGEGNVGKTFVICDNLNFTTNFHGIIIQPIKNEKELNLDRSIFVATFLYYMKHIGIMDKLSVGGQGGSFAIQYWDILRFPNISIDSFKLIAKLYNNAKDVDLFSFNFEDIKTLGIYQLNNLIIKGNNIIEEILSDIKNDSLKPEHLYIL